MGLLDSLFGSGSSKSTTEVKYPDWVNSAAQGNYDLASQIASRPYTPYPYARIAGFTDDQNSARDLLRSFMPNVEANSSDISLPRLIDNIGGSGGGISDYMSPYLDDVLGSTQKQIGRSADMAKQWQSNMGAHSAGAFGDSRHGVADSEIDKSATDAMSSAASTLTNQAYNTAMGQRDSDINRMLDTAQFNRSGLNNMLSYVDSLYRSGSNEQNLNQQSANLGYQDFLDQLNYPIQQYNLLTSALTQSPYGNSTTSAQPTSSTAGSILGSLGSLASLFL